MSALLMILSVLFAIGSLIAWIVILVAAFRDAIWKGLLGLLCGLYLLYYAIFDYEDDNKWLIIILAFGGASIAAGLRRLAH